MKSLIGGRPNIVPGAIVFGLAGLGGQLSYQLLNPNKSRQDVGMGRSYQELQRNNQGYFGRFLSSENSPIRKLSVHEYNDIMRSKILAVEADIALVNEEITRLQDRKAGKE